MPSRVTRSLARIARYFSLVMLSSCALLVFGTRGFSVFGSCMEPNLRTGERVLASSLPFMFRTPERGEVVIFRYPGDPSKNYVKRVVGLPGDLVVIRQGRVYVNGSALDEPYKARAAHGDYGPERVRNGCLFVLGDNRDQSNDSRFWGELPVRNVQAKAFLRYWPPDRVHLLK